MGAKLLNADDSFWDIWALTYKNELIKPLLMARELWHPPP